MSKPNTKRESAARKRRPMTPAKQRSAARVADDEDDDDDDDLDIDEELELFVRRPPVGADHIVVIAVTAKGDEIVQDRSLTEARTKPNVLMTAMMASCERWARVAGRVTTFRATWFKQDKVLSAHQWQCGAGKDPTELDGTVESFLAQHQRHAEAQQRLHLEGFGMVQDSWRSLLSLAHKRIEALEKDNEDLRDRLRKADDVGSDIARETALAELEARGRTADMMENKLLPMAQALMLKQLEVSQLTAASAPPSSSGSIEK